MTLEAARKFYSEEIRWNANLHNEEIVRAFRVVPREKYLGAGPWKIKPAAVGGGYRDTPDDNPEHLYHNVLVALDPERGLNNGLPSWLAEVMQLGGPRAGETIVHFGAGVGYYTAIFAELVGNSGKVIGVEIDPGLAERAKINLQSYSQVEAHQGDATTFPLQPNSIDLIFVNAGATHIPLSWITALRDGGRITVPLTFDPKEIGQILRITRQKDRYLAECVHGVYIYPLIGGRSDKDAQALKKAVQQHGWLASGELRLDPQNADRSCWLKSEEYWISRRKIEV